MSKRKKLLIGYILLFLVLAFYIAVTVPFPKTVIFWIACLFTAPAFLAQIYTLHTIIGQEIEMKDRALDFPKLRISVLYFIIQFAASLLLMNFAARIAVWAAAAIELGILLLAAIGFYAVEAACTEVRRQDTQMQDTLANMQSLKERINSLIPHCDQEQMQDRVHRLADEMQYYNPTSTKDSLEIENEMADLLTQIEDRLLASDADNVSVLCDCMTELLKEREKICKSRR